MKVFQWLLPVASLLSMSEMSPMRWMRPLVAVARTGRDVGTPILTFGPPDGPSIFGPVISSVPETDEECLAVYDATVTLCSFSTFSELKRSARPRLDLPAITGRSD